MRLFVVAAVFAANLWAQFEAVSIKPSVAGETLSIRVRGSQFVTAGTTLSDLIAYAYSVHPQQIRGGAEWLRAEGYDVQAAGSGPFAPAALRSMVRELLSSRFHLAIHTESRELPVYALTALPEGERKLVRSQADPSGGAGVGFNGPGAMTVRNATMMEFAGLLQRYVLDRPAIDRTGIDGKYDLSLRWTPDVQLPDRTGKFAGAAGRAVAPEEAPDLFIAIRQQLGLRLQAVRAQMETLVIDHAERPDAN